MLVTIKDTDQGMVKGLGLKRLVRFKSIVLTMDSAYFRSIHLH